MIPPAELEASHYHQSPPESGHPRVSMKPGAIHIHGGLPMYGSISTGQEGKA
jgi:hypothetical protein